MTRKASSRGIFALLSYLVLVEDGRRSSRSRVFVCHGGSAPFSVEFPGAGLAAVRSEAAAFQTARGARRLALAFERQLFERAAAVLSRARFERVGWPGEKAQLARLTVVFTVVTVRVQGRYFLSWPRMALAASWSILVT